METILMTKNEQKYIATFDNQGFEMICNITSYERRKLLADIQGTPIASPFNLRLLIIRANANPQRDPEIWAFSTTDSITEEDLIQMSKEQPQATDDMIRRNGKCLFRTKHKDRIIK